MKAIATSAAAAALLAGLTGCDRLGIGGGGNGANAAAGNASAGGKDGPGNSAAPQTAEAAGGKLDAGGGATPASVNGITLDRTFLMGRWTDNGDCSKAIEFTQDGHFINPDGGSGLWNLDGNRLTMSGNATATIRISPIDQDTITVINADGSLGRSTRC